MVVRNSMLALMYYVPLSHELVILLTTGTILTQDQPVCQILRIRMPWVIYAMCQDGVKHTVRTLLYFLHMSRDM